MAESPPIFDDTFRRNVAALAARQPAVAALLEEQPVPAEVRLALGRDGTSTFLVPDAAGGMNWLGGTSMPSVSAEELYGQSAWSGGNAVLPGVLSGLEPIVIARRLPDHAAAFVVEPHALAMKLAMHVYDYVPSIDAGRLVFLVECGLEEQMASFFEANIGYEIPRQILPCASRSPAQIAELQCRLERLGSTILQSQVRSMERSAAAIRGRSWPSEPALGAVPGRPHGEEHRSPRVAVLSTVAGRAITERAARVARAMDFLSWSHAICVPDRPWQAHVSARLRAIEHRAADWVLFLESWPGETRKLLPPELPVVAWFTHGPGRPSVNQAVGRNDLFFAETTGGLTALVQSGAPADQVHRLPPAADVDPSEPPAMDQASGSRSVIVVADLPDDRPEAADVQLSSHVSLWRTLQVVLRERADGYRESTAESFLEDAQKRSGVSLAEPSVRASFLECLRTRIAPAAAARHIVERLAQAGLEVHVFGHGWEGRGAPRVSICGALPAGPLRQKALETSAWLVLPTLELYRCEIALEALACGVAVAMRAGPTPVAEEHPGLIDVAGALAMYRTSAELLAVVTAGARTMRDEACRTASLVRRRHSVAERLKTIEGMLVCGAPAGAVGTRGASDRRTAPMIGST